jgi:tetratricopeptide (TPR) repeat protein
MSAATLTLTPTELESARAHHAQNHLLQAAEFYHQALIDDPRNQPALLGLSLIARQTNQLQPALHMAKAALAAGPASALAWANLGDALIAIRHAPQAKAAFRHALTLEPSLAAAHYGLGNVLALEENYPDALTHFAVAAEHAPQSSECHFAKAFAQGKMGAHGAAIAAYRRAVQLRPGFASAWLNLGVGLVADGRGQLADHCYREALKVINPAQRANHPNWINACANTRISAHLNLGHLHRSRRHFPQAQKHYEAALAVTVENDSHLTAIRLAEVQVAFTYLHLEQKQFPQAWQALREAEATDRPNSEVPNARGILLLAEHATQADPNPYPSLIEEAIQAFQQAESLGHKTAPSNRGNALLRLSRCEEALAAHQTALERDPHHPGILYNLALTQLRTGDFARGWPNYEIRWQFREVHPHPRRFSQPRWQGETLSKGSRLFIYSEQGLGDTLQFLRYLSLVAERSPDTHLILEVQAPLVRLLTPYLTTLTKSCHPERFCHPERSEGCFFVAPPRPDSRNPPPRSPAATLHPPLPLAEPPSNLPNHPGNRSGANPLPSLRPPTQPATRHRTSRNRQSQPPRNRHCMGRQSQLPRRPRTLHDPQHISSAAPNPRNPLDLPAKGRIYPPNPSTPAQSTPRYLVDRRVVPGPRPRRHRRPHPLSGPRHHHRHCHRPPRRRAR